MKSFILLISLFVISFNGFGQLNEAKKALLRTELIKHVNNLRDSLGIPLLEEDPVLKKAAETHSNYMAKTRTLSHKEKSGATKTVTKRVKKSGSKEFILVGENILESPVKDLSMNKKEIIALSKEMFEVWKNSAGHYANMTNPEYVYGDFGFKESPRNNHVYATQVFGTKGITIDGALSDNDFGIRAGSNDCGVLLQQMDNIVSNIGNDIQIENDTVKLYFHDIGMFKRIISGTNDGLAVDLIRRSQFECNAPNQLDMSKVRDGIMLEPVYRSQLLKGNQAKSEYRLITSLGTVPESLKGEDLLVSIILIKNKQMCRYLVPAFVPRAQYELADYQPELLNPNLELKTEGIIESEVLEYNFKTNVTTAIHTPKPSYPKKKVHSVQIVSYSSIEGDSLKNISLHKNRGRFIENKLRSQLRMPGAKVEHNASENWAKMRFQLGYLMADSLLTWSHQELRNLVVSDDDSQDWDSLLYDQRSSRAIINYYGSLKSGASLEETAVLNLRTAIATKNYDLANKAIYELWNNGVDDPSFMFEGAVFEAFMTRIELVQNASALLGKYYNFDEFKSTEFINAWMERAEELSLPASSNVLNLYCHTGYELLKNWDVESKRLSNVIHPRKVEVFVSDDQPGNNLLNAQLTFLQYYGHVVDHPGMNSAFEYIKKVVGTKSLKQEEIYDLTLFFNYWSQYFLTNETLLKEYKAGRISDENTYVLAHTLSQSSKKDEVYLEVMKKALEINKERWCEWLDIEFQILREGDIKRLYCETCK